MTGCASTASQEEDNEPEETPAGSVANIVSASTSGSPGSYQFTVGVKSPDTGCEQYANWWEVIRPDGTLLYRRILTHSHITEQPFVRSGGPVDIQESDEVIVRAHMHPDGYGGMVYRGSVSGGFREATLGADFAADLKNSDPLPTGCAG